jgi:hypothetical protein
MDRKQEQFHKTLDTSLITKFDSYEVRVTETNLVVLTEWFDPEAEAHVILPNTPLYLKSDTWMPEGVSSPDERHSLAISAIVEPRNGLMGVVLSNLCQAERLDGAPLVLRNLLDNSRHGRALLEKYVRAASIRFGAQCDHGETIYPSIPGFVDMVIKFDHLLDPCQIVRSYRAMKRELADRLPPEFSRILNSSGQLQALARGLMHKVEANRTLKKTTVMMAAAEQNRRVELIVSDQHESSESYGFGTVDTDELRASCVDEPLRPAAGFDLAAQLQGMGVLAGEPRMSGAFTHYPVKDCPFNTQHKRVVLSQHRSGAITYLCPHHSCKGMKPGFERKTARDYFTHYGVTIPRVSESDTVSHEVTDAMRDLQPPSRAISTT